MYGPEGGGARLLQESDDPLLSGVELQTVNARNLQRPKDDASQTEYDEWLFLNGIRRIQAIWRGKCTRAAMASIVDFRSIGRTFRYETQEAACHAWSTRTGMSTT